jgi:hypothetical protein
MCSRVAAAVLLVAPSEAWGKRLPVALAMQKDQQLAPLRDRQRGQEPGHQPGQALSRQLIQAPFPTPIPQPKVQSLWRQPVAEPTR